MRSHWLPRLLVTLLSWILAIAILTGIAWVLDRMLPDGLAKTTAHWVLNAVAFGLFGGGSYAATRPHPSGTVRPLFRVLAGLLAPMCVLTGCLIVLWSASLLVTGGWRALADLGFPLIATGIAGIPFGVLLFRAAWTGRDPYAAG
jgi:hypothetical protein